MFNVFFLRYIDGRVKCFETRHWVDGFRQISKDYLYDMLNNLKMILKSNELKRKNECYKKSTEKYDVDSLDKWLNI